MTPILRMLGTAAVLAVLATSGARPASAQQARSPRVIVAIPDSFPPVNASAMVLRYADPSRQDVILLKRDAATADLLGGALALLRAHRGRVAAPSDDVVLFAQGAVPKGKVPAAYQAALEQSRSRLLSQQPSGIGRLGRGRWIELDDAR